MVATPTFGAWLLFLYSAPYGSVSLGAEDAKAELPLCFLVKDAGRI